MSVGLGHTFFTPVITGRASVHVCQNYGKTFVTGFGNVMFRGPHYLVITSFHRQRCGDIVLTVCLSDICGSCRPRTGSVYHCDVRVFSTVSQRNGQTLPLMTSCKLLFCSEVYYEPRTKENHINRCQCIERLKPKTVGSTRLTYTRLDG